MLPVTFTFLSLPNTLILAPYVASGVMLRRAARAPFYRGHCLKDAT